MSGFTYNGYMWIFENDTLLVRMDDKTYQKHLNAYLESQGIPTQSYLQLLDYAHRVLDQRCQAAQQLHDPAYWRECKDPDVHIVDLQQMYRAKT